MERVNQEKLEKQNLFGVNNESTENEEEGNAGNNDSENPRP